MGRKVDLLRFVAWLIVAWVSFTVFTGPRQLQASEKPPGESACVLLAATARGRRRRIVVRRNPGAPHGSPRMHGRRRSAVPRSLGSALPCSGNKRAIIIPMGGLRLDFVARPARIPLPVSADPAKASQVDCYALGTRHRCGWLQGAQRHALCAHGKGRRGDVEWGAAGPGSLRLCRMQRIPGDFAWLRPRRSPNYLWDGCFISSLTRKRQFQIAGSAIELRVAPNAEAACLLDNEAFATSPCSVSCRSSCWRRRCIGSKFCVAASIPFAASPASSRSRLRRSCLPLRWRTPRRRGNQRTPPGGGSATGSSQGRCNWRRNRT